MKNFISHKARTGLLFLLFGLLAQSGWGQVNYVSWNFATALTTGQQYAGSQTNMDGARTSSLTTPTITGVTNSTVTPAAATTFHRTTGWPYNTASVTSSASSYIEFTVTLGSGQSFDNISLSLNTTIGASNATSAPNRTQIIYGWGISPTFATVGSAITVTTSQVAQAAVTIPAPGNSSTTKLTIRLASFQTTNNTQTGNFRISTVALTGASGPLSSSPTINTSVSSFNEFSTSAISTPSAEQTLVVSGSNLTNNISIVPPTGFEISTTTGGSFSATNPITLTQSGGTVANTTIYVRYNPASLAVQPQVAGTNISATSTGATTKNVTVLGSVRNLSPGDFAIIGFNCSTTDAISFVVLTSIPANTIIKFTDNGYSDAITQMLTEGYLTYTAPSTISAGTVISWNNGMTIAGTGWNSNAPTNFSLNASGEQLFAYQGTWGVSGGTTTLHQGFMTGGTWTTTGSVTSVTANSYLPTSLTTETSAAYFAIANAYYTNNSTNTVNTKAIIFTRSSTAANWTSSASQITPVPSWTFNILADEPTTQPSFSAATSVGNNQMDLNYTGGNGTSYMVVMREGSAVTATPTDATNYSTVSGTVNFSSAIELSAGQRIVYNGTTATGTVTVSNLSAGTTYHYAIYAYNGTSTKANFYLASPGTGTQLTTGSANSNVSDIIIHSTFTEPSNIAYASNQENSNLTDLNSIEVARFTLRDGGATTDGDTNSTTLNTITFTIAGHTNLRRLALYDGVTELSEVAISTGTATFSGLTLAAVDNSSKDFSLRASFAGTVTDNSQFSFTVSSATADIAGSTFATADAGEAASSISGDRNKIEVSTTAIIINQNVSNVTVGMVMSPSPSVTALDNLANFDLDNTSNVTMTITTGTTTFDSAATITVAMVAGTATFANLVFTTVTNNNRLTATHGLLADISSLFNVISGPVTLVAGDIAVIGYNTSGAPDNFAILVLKELTAGTNFYVNDNEVSSAGDTSFADIGEVEAKFTVKTGQTIPAGTVIQLPWGAAAVSTSTYDFTSTSGAGLGSNNEEIYIYNATAISDLIPTSFIYFAKIGSSSSSIPAGLTSAITSNSPSGAALMYKTSGATYTGCTSTLLSAIGNTGSNWTSTSVPSPLVPGNWTFSSITSSANNWTGGTSTWNTVANWSCTTIPNIIDNITITNGNPTLETNFTLVSGKSLTISNTGALTINPNAILTIAGTADFGGQPVTLKSDATGTAAIGQVTGTLSNATNVTVERYIPAKRAWRALTAPLKGSANNSIFYNWQNNGSVSSGIGVELWGPGGTGTSGNNTSTSGLANGPGASIKQYGNGWSNVTDSKTTSLFTTNGNNAYMVFVTGGYGSGNISSGFADTTLKSIGQLITGPVSYTGLSSTYHTFIGNPYACPIHPSSIVNGATNLFTNVWVWDPALSTNGGYVNYDGSLGAGTYSSSGGSYTNSSIAIQSGQAFFVRAASGTGSLTLTESMKSSSISNTFRNSNSNMASIFRVGFLKQTATDWMPLDGCIAGFYEGANAAADDADGKKMINTGENIGFVRNAVNLSSEHYPLVTNQDILNLKIWNTQQAHYKLKLNTEEFTMVGVEAWLQDLYTGTSQPLNLDGSAQDYEFDVDPTVSASSGNRFRIVFTNTALAVTNPEQGQLSIYPNPATGGKVTVSLPTGTFEGCSYELINVLGQVVRQDEIVNANSSQISIPLTGLPNSWYALRILKDTSVLFQGKLIIKN